MEWVQILNNIQHRAAVAIKKAKLLFFSKEMNVQSEWIGDISMCDCAWCNLSEEERKWLLLDNDSWSVYLADEQDYIGRCILVLKRHCGSLAELTDEEFIKLKHLICILEHCLKTVLGATLCNWSCLLNDFYKREEPTPHLHLHVRPRYQSPVILNGVSITMKNSDITMTIKKEGLSGIRIFLCYTIHCVMRYCKKNASNLSRSCTLTCAMEQVRIFCPGPVILTKDRGGYTQTDAKSNWETEIRKAKKLHGFVQLFSLKLYFFLRKLPRKIQHFSQSLVHFRCLLQ